LGIGDRGLRILSDGHLIFAIRNPNLEEPQSKSYLNRLRHSFLEFQIEFALLGRGQPVQSEIRFLNFLYSTE
jgi:hypothetical protein